jgi:hypothetical protein
LISDFRAKSVLYNYGAPVGNPNPGSVPATAWLHRSAALGLRRINQTEGFISTKNQKFVWFFILNNQ